MIAVDLFCGAGGLTRGLLNAGLEVVLGIDINEDYRRSYEANNAPAKFLQCDVSHLSAQTIHDHVPAASRSDFMLAGCAPCQPFSALRRMGAARNDYRLLMEFERLVRELEPAHVFMENVPGLAKVRGFSSYRRFTATLTRLGYAFVPGVVDAKQYGVPQTRRRFVLLASRVCSPVLPPPSHGPCMKSYRTVRDAIGHFPPLAAGSSCADVANHQAAAITDRNLRRLRDTPPDGGSRASWPESLVLECHKEFVGHQDVYGRMRWDAPAPTLTCRCFGISNGRYGHPEQDRAISLREAASLQSFPEEYVFYGRTQRSLGEQIGNAVPVALAEAVGRQFIASAAAALTEVGHHSRPRPSTRA